LPSSHGIGVFIISHDLDALRELAPASTWILSEGVLEEFEFPSKTSQV
jgi:hypothetical protein